MHSDLLDQLFVSAFRGDQYADTRAVQVRTQLLAFQHSDTTDVDVFADFRYQRYALFFEFRFQRFNVGDALCGRRVQHFVSERLETSVFRNEVGLAVDFQDHAVVAVDFGFDHAVSSHVACFFRRFDRAGLTHVLNRQLDVAIRFGQRFFAVHHARASTLAQFFYQCSGNFSHSRILGSYPCAYALRHLLRKIYSVPPARKEA